jgi:uncharacterized membrane protein YidH (DUF202 family)
VTSASEPDRLSRARDEATFLVRRPELEWLARAGLVARGVVYAVIGVLALELALRTGGKAASQRGAMETIGHEPLGRVLLIILAAGLAAYAVWRVASAAAGPRHQEQHDALQRLSALASGAAYAVVCVTAIKILIGAPTAGGSNSPKHEAAGVLGWPLGPEIVGAAGAILIGVGAYQGYKAIARRFLEDSRTGEMSPPVRRTFTALGVGGHLARMVVFVLVGYGLIKAAIDYAPRNAIGLDGALQKLSRASAGPLLLGVVAAGLLSFALYSIADARYRDV